MIIFQTKDLLVSGEIMVDILFIIRFILSCFTPPEEEACTKKKLLIRTSSEGYPISCFHLRDPAEGIFTSGIVGTSDSSLASLYSSLWRYLGSNVVSRRWTKSELTTSNASSTTPDSICIISQRPSKGAIWVMRRGYLLGDFVHEASFDRKTVRSAFVQVIRCILSTVSSREKASSIRTTRCTELKQEQGQRTVDLLGVLEFEPRRVERFEVFDFEQERQVLRGVDALQKLLKTICFVLFR